MKSFFKYLWSNKILTLVALLSLVSAAYVLKHNYHVIVLNNQDYADYREYQVTNCDSACQADIVQGFMDQE